MHNFYGQKKLCQLPSIVWLKSHIRLIIKFIASCLVFFKKSNKFLFLFANHAISKNQDILKEIQSYKTLPTRIQVLIPIAIAAVVIGVVGIYSIPSDSKLESVEFPRGTIKIDDTVLEVQVADNEPRRVRGLMFQDRLPYNQGMIFVFDEPGIYSLWMLNMQFPLDMIWFDENGNVVHIEKDVPPCKTALETMSCQTKTPSGNSLYILEVASGFVDKFNITQDSKLKIISI